MKRITSYTDAFDFIALRCIFGALVLFIVLLLRGRGMCPMPFRYTLTIVLLQTCKMVGLTQRVLVNGGAGKVAILSHTMPFRVVVFAVLFLGERLRHRQYSVILTTALGLFPVLQSQQLDFSSTKSAILAILSDVSWGAGTIVARRLYTRHPHVDLLSLTSWQILYVTPVMSVVILLIPQHEIDWQPTVLWILAYSAILATALARSLRLFVLKNLPANVASLSTLAASACGVLFSWWLLSENPRVAESSGTVLTVLALVLVSRKKREAVSIKRIRILSLCGEISYLAKYQ